jgi:hypothetical protein
MLEFLRTYFEWWGFAWHIAWFKFRTTTEDRLIILFRKGKFNHLELAKRHESGNAEGDLYHFGNKRRPTKVIIPADKEDEYFDDELFIGLQDGRLLPVPLVGETDKPDTAIMSRFAEGQAGVVLMDALEQPRGAGMNARNLLKWAVLITIAAVIAFLIWHFGLHGHLPKLGQPAPTPTPTPAHPGQGGISPIQH